MISIYNDYFIENPQISPYCEGFTYGNGFFTTIKVKNRLIENIELHTERLKKTLNFFDFDYKLPNIQTKIEELLKVNNLIDSRVKVIIFKDIEGVSYLIFTYPLIENNSPVSLELSNLIRGNNPIFRYKSLNYLTNLKSSQIIFHDKNNRVLETGSANIFCQKDQKLYTPPITLPILPGTYRQFLLNKGSYNGYKIYEKEIFLNDLKNMDKVFITNSIKGILEVKNIGSITYK